MPLDKEKVRKLMIAQRMQQKELAEMCGVTEAAMSRYLSGERQPKSETLANMATALQTTSNDLLGRVSPTDSEEVFHLVARNVATIPQEIRLKLIQLLSAPQETIDNTNKGKK
ncbi:MAG: helix-turn-helix transcriptional regulator [bacterium]|nr:helix-turn-helix transcriptional regulator [bacterium]